MGEKQNVVYTSHQSGHAAICYTAIVYVCVPLHGIASVE